METIGHRVAGLDVHRDRVVVCARVVDGGGRVKLERGSFSTMTVGVGEPAVWLNEHADAGIKLSSVASGTWSQSARAMVER